MGTQPPAVLHLEDVEETVAPLPCIPPTGHQPRMGHEIRMVAQRRLAALMQPGHGHDRDGRTPETAGIPLLQGILSPGSSKERCFMNRRIPGRYVRWCERAGVGAMAHLSLLD